MALDHDTMINPPIESLLGTVDSKFTLVTLAARRARNINSYFNQLGDGLGHMIPPQVSSVARKPLSIAFEEISEHKIVWTPAPEEVVIDDEEFDAETQRPRQSPTPSPPTADATSNPPPSHPPHVAPAGTREGNRCSKASGSFWG